MTTNIFKIALIALLIPVYAFFLLCEADDINAIIWKIIGLISLTALVLILKNNSDLFNFERKMEQEINKCGIALKSTGEVFKYCKNEEDADSLINIYEEIDYAEGVYEPNRYEKICY